MKLTRTNKKGFTIVELVIVIAVIAILAAVLIPNLSRLVDKANESRALQEAESKMKADLIEANADYDKMGTEYNTAYAYKLLATSPADWSTNYKNYYTLTGGVYTAVTGESAPDFATNKYYEAEGTFSGKVTKDSDGKALAYICEANGYTCTFTIATGAWETVKGN